eukprot:7665168-Ditylum_brightwellii.AAC.2
MRPSHILQMATTCYDAPNTWSTMTRLVPISTGISYKMKTNLSSPTGNIIRLQRHPSSALAHD